jgi:hypothetical protein
MGQRKAASGHHREVCKDPLVHPEVMGRMEVMESHMPQMSVQLLELKGRKVQPARKVKKVIVVHRVRKESLVFRVLQAQWELQDCRALLEQMVQPVQPD